MNQFQVRKTWWAFNPFVKPGDSADYGMQPQYLQMVMTAPYGSTRVKFDPLNGAISVFITGEGGPPLTWERYSQGWYEVTSTSVRWGDEIIQLEEPYPLTGVYGLAGDIEAMISAASFADMEKWAPGTYRLDEYNDVFGWDNCTTIPADANLYPWGEDNTIGPTLREARVLQRTGFPSPSISTTYPSHPGCAEPLGWGPYTAIGRGPSVGCEQIKVVGLKVPPLNCGVKTGTAVARSCANYSPNAGRNLPLILPIEVDPSGRKAEGWLDLRIASGYKVLPGSYCQCVKL